MNIKKFLNKALRILGLKIVSYESLPFNKRILQIYETFTYLAMRLEKNSVNGAFVECGFGYGRSFVVLGYIAAKTKRKIYGFDSFNGFPNIAKKDFSNRNPIKGEWSVRTLSEAKKSLQNLGLFEDKHCYDVIKLVFDKNTQNPIPRENIALLHIDLDLYEGYKYALEIFWDQIQIGGIILLDEYNEVQWPGATAAVNEFLVSKGIDRDQINVINGKHYFLKS